MACSGATQVKVHEVSSRPPFSHQTIEYIASTCRCHSYFDLRILFLESCKQQVVLGAAIYIELSFFLRFFEGVSPCRLPRGIGLSAGDDEGEEEVKKKYGQVPSLGHALEILRHFYFC